MFTLEQINAIHSKVKNGADFPQYVQDMKRLGVEYYDLYVADQHSEYFGAEGFQLVSSPAGETLTIAAQGNQQLLQHALAIHQQGQTDYPTFCQQAAAAGVKKWTTHTVQMTCTYYDQADQALATEAIPLPA